MHSNVLNFTAACHTFYFCVCVYYLLQHRLCRGQLLPMFLQGTFQVSDLLSLCLHLVSQDTHLIGETFVLCYTRVNSTHRGKRHTCTNIRTQRWRTRLPGGEILFFGLKFHRHNFISIDPHHLFLLSLTHTYSGIPQLQNNTHLRSCQSGVRCTFAIVSLTTHITILPDLHETLPNASDTS